jgi:hypothetical protein
MPLRARGCDGESWTSENLTRSPLTLRAGRAEKHGRTQEPVVRNPLNPAEHRVLTSEQIVESGFPFALRMDAAARRPQLRDGR